MVARRADGLYDIPELGLVGVPEDVVPQEHRQPIPSPMGDPMLGGMPDQRLASNTPFVTDQYSGGSNYVPAPQSAGPPVDVGAGGSGGVGNPPMAGGGVMSAGGSGPVAPAPYVAAAQNPPPNASVVEPAVPTANPAELHGPQPPEGSGSGPSPRDLAWDAAVSRAERGSPGYFQKGGLQKTLEAYVNKGEGPGPSLANLRDYTAADIDRQAALEGIANEGVRYNRQLAEATDPQTLGYEDYANREQALQQQLQQQQVQRQQVTDQYVNDRADILDRIKTQAGKSRMDGYWAERGAGAQVGAILAAAFMAGGDALNHTSNAKSFLEGIASDAATRQRNILDSLGQEYSSNINALAEIQRNFLSPEAANEALKASMYRQMQNEAAAWGKRFEGMGYQNKANDIQAQLASMEADATKKALEYEHTTAYQVVPGRVVSGEQGGLRGGLAFIDRQMHGAPKETIDAAKNAYIASRQAGSPVGFPGAGPGKQDARGLHQMAASKVHLDPTFTGGIGGVGYTLEDPKTASQITNAQAQGQAALEILHDLHDLGKKVGHSIGRTSRAELHNLTQALAGKMLVASGEGQTDEKFKSMRERLNLDAYMDADTLADIDKISDRVRKDIITTVRAQIPVHSITRSPRGNDFVSARNVGKGKSIPGLPASDESESTSGEGFEEE
jgi:hypothetical protein